MVGAWLFLAVAIASEVTATLSLRKAGEGSIPFIAVSTLGYVLAFAMLVLVLRKMDVSLAYAVWSGVGTAVIALIGITFLDEPGGALRIASLALVVVGVVGLNLTG